MNNKKRFQEVFETLPEKVNQAISTLEQHGFEVFCDTKIEETRAKDGKRHRTFTKAGRYCAAICLRKPENIIDPELIEDEEPELTGDDDPEPTDDQNQELTGDDDSEPTDDQNQELTGDDDSEPTGDEDPEPTGDDDSEPTDDQGPELTGDDDSEPTGDEDPEESEES